MERELKKVPAFFRLQFKWYDYAEAAGFSTAQLGAAFKYVLLYVHDCSCAELPKDPAACILALFMKESADECLEAAEREEIPFYYCDENGNRVGEIQNASAGDLEEIMLAREIIADAREAALRDDV